MAQSGHRRLHFARPFLTPKRTLPVLRYILARMTASSGVHRHAKKSEVEGEIESQIEYQEVQEEQAGYAAQAAEGCCQHSGAGGCCNGSSRLRRQARGRRSGVKKRRGATSF